MMQSLPEGALVLVTGGAGFIGSHVVRRLVAAGFVVRVLDDLSHGRKERISDLPITLMVDDVRSERASALALEGASAVVHLAAPCPSSSGRAERLGHDITVTGTWVLLSAARDVDVARFVFASSSEVYGHRGLLLHEDIPPAPETAEGAQKLAAESYVRLFAARDHVSACALRLFSVYGPGEDGTAADASLVARLVATAAQRSPAVLSGDGRQTRDFLHVDDVASAILAALTSRRPERDVRGRVFNIASGESVSMRYVLGLLDELSGGLPSPRYAAARPGEPREVRASVTSAAAHLGFRARVGLRAGLLACLKASAVDPARARSGAPQALPAQLFGGRPPSWTLSEAGDSAVAISDADVIAE